MRRLMLHLICLACLAATPSDLRGHERISQPPAALPPSLPQTPPSEATAPEDVPSPSDLMFAEPKPFAGTPVRIELRSGESFEGNLVDPRKLRLNLGGASLTWPPRVMGRLDTEQGTDQATLRLRDGTVLRGQLATESFRLRMEFGELTFARASVRAVIATEMPAPDQPRAETPDPAAEPKEQEATPSPEDAKHEPQATPATDALPKQPALVHRPSPMVLHAHPDIFTRYPGIPTWHATPRVLSEQNSYYPRQYYGQ
ncbi:MAG: hypothetical protein KDB14_04295 [Planctomycetales bacterium]|nr:hypothetical protein [Planctomycetales bacterium]